MVPEALELVFDIWLLFLKNRLLLPLLLSTSLSPPPPEPLLVFDALEALDYRDALESVLLMKLLCLLEPYSILLLASFVNWVFCILWNSRSFSSFYCWIHDYFLLRNSCSCLWNYAGEREFRLPLRLLPTRALVVEGCLPIWGVKEHSFISSFSRFCWLATFEYYSLASLSFWYPINLLVVYWLACRSYL